MRSGHPEREGVAESSGRDQTKTTDRANRDDYRSNTMNTMQSWQQLISASADMESPTIVCSWSTLMRLGRPPKPVNVRLDEWVGDEYAYVVASGYEGPLRGDDRRIGQQSNDAALKAVSEHIRNMGVDSEDLLISVVEGMKETGYSWEANG